MCILGTILYAITHLCMQLITRTNVVWLCSCTISGTLLYPEEKEEIHGRKEKWIMPGVMEEEEESTNACISSTAGSGSNITDIHATHQDLKLSTWVIGMLCDNQSLEIWWMLLWSLVIYNVHITCSVLDHNKFEKCILDKTCIPQ